MPCTTILVGKKASNDNTTMIARTDDGFFDEKKLIVVISDGLPAHACYDIAYLPPVSVMDTHNAAQKIIRRGTKIIALALGGSGCSCYDDLKQIYPETIDCTDLKSLTGQLLKVISREFR